MASTPCDAHYLARRNEASQIMCKLTACYKTSHQGLQILPFLQVWYLVILPVRIMLWLRAHLPFKVKLDCPEVSEANHALSICEVTDGQARCSSSSISSSSQHAAAAAGVTWVRCGQWFKAHPWEPYLQKTYHTVVTLQQWRCHTIQHMPMMAGLQRSIHGQRSPALLHRPECGRSPREIA